ncbi:efflux transporter outer membrane subunit [Parabacteroides sp. OttesenSCG-928-K15]|nr:efflux transporter outer membrane subunit [Parabacteroides sp. OttesenSCG-928-K15]
MKIIYKHIILAALLLLFASSCKVGKEYVRPELNLPESLDAGRDTLSVASIHWKSLYKDPLLQSLIERALDNNRDMLIAAARVKEMAETKRISFANRFPEIGARLNAQKEQLNYGGNTPKPDPELSGKLTVAWELDFWGRLRWANEADLAIYMQTVEAQRALKLSLIAEVASTYYELMALDKELSIVKQTKAAREQGVRLAKLRYEGGLTSQTVYNQAEVELARSETLIPTLERDIRIKENDMSLLLGEYSFEIPRHSTDAPEDLPEMLPAGLPSSLLERRPDMRAAEQKLRAAHARVGVAYTNLFPRISLTGNLGLESDELTNLLKSPAWFIAGDLLQPLFAMGKNRAALKAAQARYEQEVYQYQKEVLEAFAEVNDALITIRKVKEIRESRENLHNAADEYLRLAQLQYINGIINYIDLLDAQRGLLDAQLGLNDVLLAEQLAVVHLYKVLGGGYN